jgi:4-hydroxy-tetrahydrodipicolinate synthase
MLSGSMVALVTPMDSDGAVNHSDLAKLIEFHIDAGTEALVVAGTTGEAATLSREEHIDVIARSCELADGRIPIIAGTGSNSTEQTLTLSRAVAGYPLVALMVVTPSYNKPTQEGMYRHFSTVADAVDRPLILYNVPSRTGVDLKPATVARLAVHPNITAIKEATAELDRIETLRDGCGSDFSLLSGDDATAAEFMLRGGHGVISVTANVAAAAMRKMCNFARAGNRAKAEKIDATLRGLHRDLFIESNPIPVKWAVQQMGLIGQGIRLPLTPLAEQCHDAVRAAMADAGIKSASH